MSSCQHTGRCAKPSCAEDGGSGQKLAVTLSEIGASFSGIAGPLQESTFQRDTKLHQAVLSSTLGYAEMEVDASCCSKLWCRVRCADTVTWLLQRFRAFPPRHTTVSSATRRLARQPADRFAMHAVRTPSSPLSTWLPWEQQWPHDRECARWTPLRQRH